MFIREYKQKNKKTGETYVKHKLVASVWTADGPRQKVIMPLGTLTIARIDWKRLAHAIECRITGQQSLLEEHDAELEQLALKLVSNNKLSKGLELQTEEEQNADQSNNSRFIPIDLNSVKLKETRSLGAEMICSKMWEMLGFECILKGQGLSAVEISIARVLIFGRLISPGSERHTIEWFRKRSALQEIPGMSDLRDCGKDRFYNLADVLFSHKDAIEAALYKKEREFFPHSERTIFLYDLTNVHFEGGCLKNTRAKRGHAKNKRTDCPLITLSLVVSDDGMPMCSEIYDGNQSEPATLPEIVERLMRQMYGCQLPFIKPTIAMDKGIATEQNVQWLKENEFHYVVIKREDDRTDYCEMFENGRETFELIGSKKSIYGDDNSVYVQKISHTAELCRVLCISEGKARKEAAIAMNKKDLFLVEIENFERSIQKGTIKNVQKIHDKLQRIIGKHGRRAAKYDISMTIVDEKIIGISVKKKVEDPTPLYGCYVIESTHTDLSAKEIWHLYMTLTRVESAFRSMKETLGMRPLYHKSAGRSEGHLFITVLAYHILATIENILTSQGETRTWESIRTVMSTLVRGTVTARDDNNATYSLRLSGEPEVEHQAIFDKLNISTTPKTIISKIATL